MRDRQSAAVPAALPGSAAAAVDILLSRTPLIMWVTDAQLRIQWVRGGAVRMLGLDQLCGIGSALAKVFDSPDHPIVERHRQALAGRSCSLQTEWMDRSYDMWIEPLVEDGAITGSMAIAIDVTDSRRAERILVRHAGFDVLTGALNRPQFCEQLETLIGQARRRGNEISLLCVDVDGFAAMNDSFGTAEADRVLRGVYERIAAAAPSTAIVGRVGADAFAVVLESARNGIDAFCADLQQSFAEPLAPSDRQHYVGVSIGTAMYPRDGGSVERLLSCAAAAARHAADLGGRRSHEFSPALTINNRQHLQIESDLREALRRNELFLVYQPQVRIDDQSLAGVEVLLRWRRNGEVLPAWTFVPQAEASSVIVPVGDWVIDTAFRQMKEWRDRGLDPGRLAINIGARQLADDSIVGTIRDALAKHGLPGSAVDVEITETAAMQNVAATAGLLEDLRALGLEISIDDFGTGYSSLSYLRRFAATGLKIDRSFVADLSESATAAGIVRAIIATARVFGLRLVAEGVETEAQAAFLRDSGCAEAQGFLYSHPLDAEAMTEYLVVAQRRGRDGREVQDVPAGEQRRRPVHRSHHLDPSNHFKPFLPIRPASATSDDELDRAAVRLQGPASV